MAYEDDKNYIDDRNPREEFLRQQSLDPNNMIPTIPVDQNMSVPPISAIPSMQTPELPYNLPQPNIVPVGPSPASVGPQFNPLDLQMQTFDKQAGAINAVKNADLEQNQAIRNAITPTMLTPEQIKLNNDKIQEIQTQQLMKQKDIENKTTTVNSLLDTYGKAEVDPKRFWNNLDTGNKIMAGVSIFLGGLKGGENNALKIIDRAIDADIAAQKSNIEKQGGKITQERGLLADLRGQLGSMQSAESMYHAIAATNVQNQLSIAAARSGDQKVKAQADMAISQLDQAKTKFLTDAIQTAQSNAAEAALSPITTQDQMLLKAMNNPAKAALFVRGPGFSGFVNGDKADATKIKDATVFATTSLNKIDRMMSFDRSAPLSDVKAEAEVLNGILKGNLRNFFNGTARLNEEDRAVLDDIIANPANVFQAHGKKKLETLKDAILNKLHEDAKTYGLNVNTNYNQVVGAKEYQGKPGKK